MKWFEGQIYPQESNTSRHMHLAETAQQLQRRHDDGDRQPSFNPSRQGKNGSHCMLCVIACTHILHSLNVSLQPAVKTASVSNRLCAPCPSHPAPFQAHPRPLFLSMLPMATGIESKPAGNHRNVSAKRKWATRPRKKSEDSTVSG